MTDRDSQIGKKIKAAVDEILYQEGVITEQPPTRTERCDIHLKLDAGRAEGYARSIEALTKRPISQFHPLKAGNTLSISYQFKIDYLGEVEACLSAIERLLDDPSVVAEADLKELEHGRSLLVSVVRKLTKVREKLGKRSRKPWYRFFS